MRIWGWQTGSIIVTGMEAKGDVVIVSPAMKRMVVR
jgi:hypothetical protein